MIKNTVAYAGQTLLTVYHKGFDEQIGDRKLKRTEKLGKYNLSFYEEVVSDNEIDNISDWSWKLEGLLDPKEIKNPYSNGTCAYMEHYVFLNKPNKIFRFKDNKYVLKLSVEDLHEINSFVKKYTGLNIEENPMLYGDVLIFEGHVRNYHADKDEGIIVNNVKAETNIIVHFKDKGAIVSTKIVYANCDADEVTITADKKWSSHDIEIYQNNELIYFDRDVSYMRRMHLNLNLKEQGKVIKLSKLDDYFILKGNDSKNTTVIGETADESEEIIFMSNSEISRQIKNEKDDNRVIFIKPGELNKAMKVITDIMQAASSDMWIFDSYFTDKQGIRGTLDWLRILAYCKANTKNVVFYCKVIENSFDIGTIGDEIKKDMLLNDILRNKNEIGIHFYQTKSPIHDRFIITSDNGEFSGIAIGTSFNSLGENHYCIHKLSHKAAVNIWEGLKEWLDDGNVVCDGIV